MRRAIIFLAALSLASAAHSAEWLPVVEGSTGVTTEVDTSTITKAPGGKREAWTRRVRPDKTSIVKSEFDCAKRTSTTVFFVTYLPDGSSSNAHNVPYHLREASPAIPGSVIEAVINFVCSAP